MTDEIGQIRELGRSFMDVLFNKYTYSVCYWVCKKGHGSNGWLVESLTEARMLSVLIKIADKQQVILGGP